MFRPESRAEFLILMMLLAAGVIMVTILIMFFTGVIRVPASVHDVYWFTHCEPARLPTGIMGWRCQ